MRSPELDYYFKVKITKPGAQVLITQLGLFIHHRRDCWSHVSGNCPHMSVKQKILQHEYGEVIKDNYTEHGHMELIVRQGKALGLTPEQVMNVDTPGVHDGDALCVGLDDPARKVGSKAWHL